MCILLGGRKWFRSHDDEMFRLSLHSFIVFSRMIIMEIREKRLLLLFSFPFSRVPCRLQSSRANISMVLSFHFLSPSGQMKGSSLCMHPFLLTDQMRSEKGGKDCYSKIWRMKEDQRSSGQKARKSGWGCCKKKRRMQIIRAVEFGGKKPLNSGGKRGQKTGEFGDYSGVIFNGKV